MTRFPPKVYLDVSNGDNREGLIVNESPSHTPLFALELDSGDYLRRLLAFVSCSLRLSLSPDDGASCSGKYFDDSLSIAQRMQTEPEFFVERLGMDLETLHQSARWGTSARVE
jgi:hypothetical protein